MIYRISARTIQAANGAEGEQQEGDNLNKQATYYAMRIVDGEEVKLAAVGSQATYKAILLACKAREILFSRGINLSVVPSYSFQEANEEAVQRGVQKVRSIELNFVASV